MNLQLILILVFAVLFPATHLLMSHGPIRQRLIRSLGGIWPFRGVYTLVSLLTFLPLVVLWWDHRGIGPQLWELPFWFERAVAIPLMLLAMLLLVMMLATPSPASMIPGMAQPRGILRITRHPMNMAFALFGLAHLLANGALADVAFFGQFVILGVVGAYHQDARMALDKGERYRDLQRSTSVLPFGAILAGRNRLVVSELAFPMLLIALVAFAALLIFHRRLFGVAVF